MRGRVTRDQVARRVAIAMLKRGLFTVPEAARFAGVSIALVRYWCSAEELDWKRVRLARLTAWWHRELSGDRRPSKRELRHLAVEAKETWDHGHDH